jgi:hypothetical protein
MISPPHGVHKCLVAGAVDVGKMGVGEGGGGKEKRKKREREKGKKKEEKQQLLKRSVCSEL